MKKVTCLTLCLFTLFACQLRAQNVPTDRDLNEVVKKGLVDAIPKTPLEVTEVSVGWTKSERDASGRFSAKSKTTERLYKPVAESDALKKLGIADFSEKELDEAIEKISNLPGSYRNSLRNAFPTDKLNFPKFYDVIVQRGAEVPVRGSVKLVKYGNNDWQVEEIQVNPLSVGNEPLRDGVVSESKLPAGSRLDDPKTKEAVNAIMQNRKNFIAKIDTAVNEWKREQEFFNDIVKKALIGREDFSKLPLEIIAVVGDWTDKTTDEASGTFSVRTRATEKFYKSVSRDEGLQKLGMSNLYERELSDTIRQFNNLAETYRANLRIPNTPSDWKFYDVFVQKGGDITLGGRGKLIKYGNDDWEAEEIEVDLRFMEDSIATDSNLEDGYRLDDPITKESVAAVVKNRKDFIDNVHAAVEKKKQDDEKQVKIQNAQRKAELLERLRTAVLMNDWFHEARGYTNNNPHVRGANSEWRRAYAVAYGTVGLQNSLRNANARLNDAGQFADRNPLETDVRAIEAKIREEQEKIARQTFYWNRGWRRSDLNVVDLNNTASFLMSIDTGFVIAGTEQGMLEEIPLFQKMGVTVNRVASHNNNHVVLSVSGNTASIRELWENSGSYAVAVWFDNLRYTRNIDRRAGSPSSGDIQCNILRITVYDSRDRNSPVLPPQPTVTSQPPENTGGTQSQEKRGSRFERFETLVTEPLAP